MINKKNKQGFTLIELLVVIAIIGLLSTLSILALNTARARARDAKRIADVKEIQTALEMYFNDAGAYPATLASTSLVYGTSTYLATLPVPPTPVDGTCTYSTYYTYAGTTLNGTANASYTLQYCLGTAINNVPGSTLITATPAGIK
jgi:general secretion pathway protein G